MATINPFIQPIDYATDVQSPFEAALGGFKLGSDVATIQATQQKRELERQALEKAQEKQTDLENLFKNPNATAEDYARVTAFLPKDQAEGVRKSFEMMTGEQQQTRLAQSGQIFSALKAGQPEIAKNLLKDQAVALRNSGRENDAKAAETYLQLIDLNPTGAQTTIGLMMAQLPGGKEYLENVDKTLSTMRVEALAPSELRQKVADADKAVADATLAQAKAKNAPEREAADAARATADAKKAQVDADFARAKAVLDAQQQAETIRKTGVDIRKTEADILIDKENARIAALNAAAAKETNNLKRQELQQKIDDAKEKRDAIDRDQKATVSNQSADIDNFLNTAQRVLNTPEDVIKSATGPVASRLPTLSSDVSDFEALVEALGSQAFIAQIPKIKGTGSLSEKEGDKLQASLQTLSLKQSPARLKENVTEAVRLLTKVRENIALKYGVQAPPIDIPSATEVLVNLPNGQTLKFPNQAAADAFKKKAGI
jgi:hypothetical protein